MVPHLLQALEFRSNNATHRPLIEALELLKRYASSSQRLYPADEKVPLQGVVPPVIEELVVHKDAQSNQRVDRINYEICVLPELRERVRCKELWVGGADGYRNPDEDLPQDFDAKRDNYYAELGQPRDVEAFMGCSTPRRSSGGYYFACTGSAPTQASSASPTATTAKTSRISVTSFDGSWPGAHWPV